MNYRLRQTELLRRLRKARLNGLLVSHLPNVQYLCGFTGTAGALLVESAAGGGRLTFFTDGRYTQQAAEQVQGAKVVIAPQPPMLSAAEYAGKRRGGVVGFEADSTPYSSYRRLAQLLRGSKKLQPVQGIVEELRAIKDPEELQQMRAAADLAGGLFRPVVTTIRPGMPETAVAGQLELQARLAGAEGMSFDTIVASGTRSALPHGRASSQTVPDRGFIILDYGVILAGYCSDMTRTVHMGRASAEHRRMYEAVLKAQMASIEAVRPGVEAGEVDRAGREVLRKTGYDAYFTHSTGHGVGIEVHEMPRLAKGQTLKLMPGMVVTIEPGVYIPDVGGIRIEDMVLVTDSGHEVLTTVPKDLIEL